jgi:hypothetical protein
MERPRGVTILAVLYFSFACMLVLLAVASILGMGFLSHTVADKADTGGLAAMLFAGAGIFLAFLFFIFALVCWYVGKGLLQLSNWARRLPIVVSLLWAWFSGMALIASLVRFSAVGIISNSIQLGINVWIIWYLNQGHVKEAFGVGTVQAGRTAGSAGA